jgi:uncharacterized membrane protein
MPSAPATPARLEAFSDGVIAVIITIMVLELHVLREVLPTLLIYALSFAWTGIYWINHRHLIARSERIDTRILYANLIFLFCLSLLPFFTSFLLAKHLDSDSVALYAASNTITGFSFMLLRLAITRRLRLDAALTPQDTATQRKHWLSLAIYLPAIPLAYRYPRIALGVIAVVTLVWIIPTVGVEPCDEDRRDPVQ